MTDKTQCPSEESLQGDIATLTPAQREALAKFCIACGRRMRSLELALAPKRSGRCVYCHLASSYESVASAWEQITFPERQS